jgi:hypothetical protein
MYPGLQFGVGIVRFNDGRRSNPYIPDSIDSSQVKLLSQFTTLSALINWIDTTYTPVGGDDYELQLDALHIAVHDMMNSSARRKYVVLLTDSPFHDNEGGSTVTKQHVLDDITALGCPVYLSLWDIFGELSQYSDFVSIGCEYAWANYTGNDTSGNWKYPLEDLRARIPWE